MVELLYIPYSPWSERARWGSPPRVGLKLGEASHAAYPNPKLAERYQNLVAWRNELYAAHRGAA